MTDTQLCLLSWVPLAPPWPAVLAEGKGQRAEVPGQWSAEAGK